MLVLTRKTQQRIQIGENITITVLRVKGRSVRIGIEAPTEVKVLRAELPSDGLNRATAVEATTETESLGRPAVTAREMARADKSSSATERPLAAALLRRRTPGSSAAPSIRYPNRLGAASLRGLVSPR